MRPLVLEFEGARRGLYKGAASEGHVVFAVLSLSSSLLSKLPFLALSLHLFAFCLRFLWLPLRFLEVASPISSPPHRATFFGLYRCLLGVRASGWSVRFEECMVASAEAREFVEDLGSVEASIANCNIPVFPKPKNHN
jgi:hypothetical protein